MSRNWSIYEGDDGALEGPPSRDCLATSILAWRATLVVAGCVPEIPLIETDVHRGNKAQSGFNGCEGSQPSRVVASIKV